MPIVGERFGSRRVGTNTSRSVEFVVSPKLTSRSISPADYVVSIFKYYDDLKIKEENHRTREIAYDLQAYTILGTYLVIQ